VDLRTRNTLWAADQVFETRPGTPCWREDVVQWLGFDCPGNATDEWLLKSSPRRFGQVAVAKVLSTLPDP
ncbi:MAG TPA: hypothetical protein VHI52_18455, partial [Verrucomicrobiae bacterium]|nr:hypothetical protein [Verrucomicrobiae bacterium]